MFKKIHAFIVLSCLSMTVLGVSVGELNDQLLHLQAQIKKVTLSWQRAEVTLRQAQKIDLILYHEAQSDAKDILAREEIITKIDDLVNQEADSIVTNKKPYTAINFLADNFPTLLPTIEPTDTPEKKAAKRYLSSVIAALANREFRLLLGRKLVSKERRLMLTIKRAQRREEAELA